MSTEFIFELSKPLAYAHAGEMKETSFITLREPSYKNIEQCVPIKQAFFRAATSIAESQTSEESSSAKDAEMKPEDIVAMFYQSGEDMLKILLHGVELFKSPGIALVGGEERMTTKLIEDMGSDDLERMFGAYLVNFLLASLLNKADQV